MFKNKSVAHSVLSELENSNKILDDSLYGLQRDKCDEESYAEYRRLIGLYMGYVYTDIKQPIYKGHSDLEPDELKSGN